MEDHYPNFLPQWTNAVEHIFANRSQYSSVMTQADNEFNLDWFSSRCCLTGEAFFHHGAPIKECGECRLYTYDRSQLALYSLKSFYKYKTSLASHLQDDHPEIWDRWVDIQPHNTKLYCNDGKCWLTRKGVQHSNYVH